ncbi:hypothetical protein Pmani_016308 [Petrolisthes manimaculis]|uniref:Uncharacterized protein n=1 Tax=Petrolisthes manimaculis TaxID=1843537 RepID=A0AAE1U6H8_9EUCA|nr:hypothetical protein Pmani_016308 [Petrolisthes manimaculis]
MVVMTAMCQCVCVWCRTSIALPSTLPTTVILPPPPAAPPFVPAAVIPSVDHVTEVPTSRDPRRLSLVHTGQFSTQWPSGILLTHQGKYKDTQQENTSHDGKVVSSSWLNQQTVENIIEVMKRTNRFNTGPTVQHHMDPRVILAPEVYQGRETLVYKLAPGIHIFNGVPAKYDSHKNTDVHSEPNYNYDTNSKALSADLTTPGKKTEIQPDKYEYNLQETEGSYYPASEVREESDMLQAADTRPAWRVHYRKPPLHLSAMHNPYRTQLRKGNKRQKHQYIKASPGKSVTDLVLFPFAHGIRKTHTGFRSAWLSFLLLHYLGFLPELPGVPRHRDPATLRHSTRNTITRRLRVYRRGQGDDPLLVV